MFDVSDLTVNIKRNAPRMISDTFSEQRESQGVERGQDKRYEIGRVTRAGETLYHLL